MNLNLGWYSEKCVSTYLYAYPSSQRQLHARILIELLWDNIIACLMNFRILPMTLLEFRCKGSNKLTTLLLCPLSDQTPVSRCHSFVTIHSLAVGRLSGLLSQHFVINGSHRGGGVLKSCLWTGRFPLSTQSKKSCSVVLAASAKARCPYHISHINSPKL